jgi:hypothetical protein
MGKLLISHRSTIYPCFIPDLGEFTGAGRIRLTQHKITKKCKCHNNYFNPAYYFAGVSQSQSFMPNLFKYLYLFLKF